MIRNGWAFPALAMVLTGTSGLALAQKTGDKPPAATQVAQPAPPETPPVTANPAEAKAVLDRARQAYRELKTYQDTANLKFELRAKDAKGADRNDDDNEQLTFVYAGQKKFALVHSDFAVYCDGQTQTAYMKFSNQYLQRPASEGIIEEAAAGPIGILSAVHAPAGLLTSPRKFEKDFPLLIEPTGMKPEELEGKPGKRVWAKGELPGMTSEERVPMTAWFADDTGLLGEVTIDLKSSYSEMLQGEATVERATGTITFKDMKVNAEVSADKYSFTPTKKDKKVKSFDPQQELVGDPVPTFQGADLDGKPLGISDFKGKIVLLYFWAAGSDPSTQAIAKIQELATEFADKGVVVLGVNEDEAPDKAKQAVEEKKLTFRQVADSLGEAAMKFRVEEIPCMVLIDAKGVVQWIRTGGSPGMKADITERLDKLVKGESLVKVEEQPK